MADVADVSASSGDSGRTPRMPAFAEGAVDPSDECLAARVANGDAVALGALYDRYGQLGYSLARHVGADGGVAGEVVREVFGTFWGDPQMFDPNRGRFASWLLALVHHQAIDRVRRVGRRVPAADGDDWWLPSEPPASLAADEARDALFRLSDAQRRAFTLSYYGGYTQEEIASITGSSLASVKMRIFDAVNRLRELLVPSRWESVQTSGERR